MKPRYHILEAGSAEILQQMLDSGNLTPIGGVAVTNNLAGNTWQRTYTLLAEDAEPAAVPKLQFLTREKPRA